ncbi:TonB family protein [Thioclava sp. F36-6]|uniref:energy transducer TonB n=1 Tax=Thioclava sp. F36-6 TaxID=1915316 RepID=UPI0009976955|nr:TonB family protein [Thioclava sp. F36-6]OOY31037.1 hypothetical protein BMI88_07765 [Thioclava sp. F36-6]
MTRGALIAFAALAASAGLHALGLAQTPVAAPELPPAGGQAAQEAPLLGNDFADLAAGRATPVVPERAEPIARKVTRPVQPETPAMPKATSPSAPAAPDRLAAVTPTPETLRAQSTLAPQQSQRPEARPKRPAPQKATKLRKQAQSEAKPAPPSNAGNAARDARRGTSQGAARARDTADKGQPAKAPSAARSGQSPRQYAASVIRKIQSTPKRRGQGRGRAVVGFVISANGRLSTVRILRGSGSSGLDAAALDHVRRAAPFPPPPKPGMKFSFEFVARG